MVSLLNITKSILCNLILKSILSRDAWVLGWNRYCFCKLLLFPLGVSCTVEFCRFSSNFFISGDFIIWAVLMTLSPVLPTESSWGISRYAPFALPLFKFAKVNSLTQSSQTSVLCSFWQCYQHLFFHHIWPNSLKLVARRIYFCFPSLIYSTSWHFKMWTLLSKRSVGLTYDANIEYLFTTYECVLFFRFLTSSTPTWHLHRPHILYWPVHLKL